MNNIELNEDQLWQLREFIMHRGIKEPDVINEILDHFACKVEEIWSREKNLSLEKVMQLAHQSFGASGFRPLIAQYENHLEQVTNSIFKQELKKVLSSPKVLFIISFGLIFVPILNLLGSKIGNHWFFDMELISLLSIVLVSSLYAIIMFKKHQGLTKDRNKKKKTTYLWQRQRFAVPHMPVLIIFFITPFLYRQLDPKLFTTAMAFFMVVTLIRVLTQYQTYLAIEKRFDIKTSNAMPL
ncbi:MAG: hypothetical protein V4561_06035 [Bacteroidota bacterium]